MAVVLAFKATTGSPFAPVTTANAFAGQSIGSDDLLVAEAPQSMGRTMTVAYAPPSTPLAFGGFRTQSTADEHAHLEGNQSKWGQDRVEDRVIDGAVKLSAITETSSITKTESVAEAPAPRLAPEPRKAPEAQVTSKAKLAAAAYEDSKPRKKSASNDDDGKSEKSGKSKKSTKTASKSQRSKSRREVASYEDRGYREAKARVAYSERSYGGGNGYSDGGRSAGQTMSDNFRPL
jgi:hypothetical protein